MANKVRPVNNVFGKGARSNLIRGDFLDADLMRSKQANNEPSLMNATNWNGTIIKTITLPVRMPDYEVRVVFGAVRNSAVSVSRKNSFIDSLVKGICRPERMIVP